MARTATRVRSGDGPPSSARRNSLQEDDGESDRGIGRDGRMVAPRRPDAGKRRGAALSESGPDNKSPAFEDYPLTRMEYITALVHFYRAEMSRSISWRARLDTTTNWAVLTMGGMLSFAFSDANHSHVTLLLANLLVVIFMAFEARRFRYFDVWRSRLRMLEENFFIPIFRRNLISPRHEWREFIAGDLDEPKFKITVLYALGVRLRKNYSWMFLVILVAWLLKLTLHPVAATQVGEFLKRMAVGPLAWPVVAGLALAFYATLIGILYESGRQRGSGDEVQGIEAAMDHWKR